MLEALGPTAEREGVDPQKLLERPARRRAPEDAARGPRRAPGDRADRRAATPIPLAQAEAREKLWTPDQDAEDAVAAGARRRGPAGCGRQTASLLEESGRRSETKARL